MEMISFEKAYDIVMESAKTLGTESVHFMDSLDRILAQEVVSDTDMPPFNKASMDGFACRTQDLDLDLEIIEGKSMIEPLQIEVHIQPHVELVHGDVQIFWYWHH